MTVELITGSANWVCPSQVFSVKLELWGAGGSGGGGGLNNSEGGGGGGGGQYVCRFYVAVNPGTTYGMVIGTGGLGVVQTDGNNGDDSTFNINWLTAKGGTGGKSYANGGAGGTGDSATPGNPHVRYIGGNGGNGGSTYAAGGGGGAGSTGIGGTPSTETGAGGGANEYGGNGGVGTDLTQGDGGVGDDYGGGGGGATKAGTSGNGANGLCRLTYFTAKGIKSLKEATADVLSSYESGLR